MFRPRALFVLIGAVCLASAQPAAQQGVSGGRTGGPPPTALTGVPAPRPAMVGTGAISGVVTDGATHRPVAGALVYLGMQGHGPVNQASRQITDAKGRFVFVDLPASDRFFLNVNKAGYNDGHYGDSGPVSLGVASGLVTLAEGQWFRDANIPVWRPGAIAGTVLDEAGEPVVGAYVRVLARIFVAGAPHLAAGAATRTDDRGHYRIAGLSPGTYLVNVPSVQSAVPAATPAQEIEGISPQGNVRPSDDAPLRNNGALDLGNGQLLIVGNYPTPPISVSGQPEAYPMAFAPGVAVATDAALVELRNGDRRDNVDILLRPVPAVRVSGRLSGPPDVFRGLVLRLVAAGLEDLATGSEVATTLVGAAGDFTFLNVPAGDYTLSASRSQVEYSYGPPRALSTQALPGTPGLVPGPGTLLSGVPSAPAGTSVNSLHSAGDLGYSARMPVSVGATDVSGLSVPLRRSVSMHGRVAFDGDGPAPGQTAIIVEPADGSAALGLQQSTTRPTADADPQFTIDGLGAGEYVFRIIGLSPRQAVKSITVGGVDYTTRRIDGGAGQDVNDVVITYTDRIATVTGSVQGNSVASRLMSVIAFPAARDEWTRYGLTPARFRSVPVSNTGTYTLENLPAGQYLLVAVDSADARRWQDPAFLEEASKAAAHVTVDWGGTPTQDLRLSVIK